MLITEIMVNIPPHQASVWGTDESYTQGRNDFRKSVVEILEGLANK